MLCQIRKVPEDSIINLAKEYKFKYPEESVIITSSLVEVNFDVKKGRVIAELNSTNNYLNLDTKSYIKVYEFYDEKSEINKFQVRYANGNKANIPEEDIAYKSNEIFYSDARIKYLELDFPLQGFEYSTFIQKAFSDIKYFTTLYLNEENPIIEKTVRINIPKWLNIELKEFNFGGIDITKEVIDNDDSKVYEFRLKNVSASVDEDHMLGPSFLYPHLLILPKKFFEKEQEKNIFLSLDDQYNWYRTLTKDLNYSGENYSSKAKQLTLGLENDLEKIKKIYYWIQDNIRYIAFEDGIAGFKPEEASQVYLKKYGDCKGMANLMKGMLKEIGVEARLTWLGTNHLIYDYSTPSLAVDNHMICTILDYGEPIFLDPTEKYNPFGKIASRIQGKVALIENGDDYILKNIPKENKILNKEERVFNLKIVNDQLVGDGVLNYKGESCKTIYRIYDKVKTDKKVDFLDYFLKIKSPNLEVSNVSEISLEDRETDISINYQAIFENKLSSFGENLYLDLKLSNAFSEMILENRKTDFLFPYKKNVIYKTIIDSKGYTVQNSNEIVSFKNENFSLELKIENKDEKLTCTLELITFNNVLPLSDIEIWNKTLKEIEELSNKQIILKKV